MEDMLGFVIGLVATVITVVGSLAVLMKWMLDSRIGEVNSRIEGLDSSLNSKIEGLDSSLNSKIDGLEKRVANLESNTHLILQHLLGVKSA